MLDADTLEIMKKPRCGVPDVKVGRFFTFEPLFKWQTNDLTYRIVNYTQNLARSEVDDSIEKALKVWADVTPLRFTRIYNGTADIMISFHRGAHGDHQDFDGPDGFLAHAFSPGPHIGGNVHFDNDETFTYRSCENYDFFSVAVHEFGHALGLFHTSDSCALMHPPYVYIENPDTFILPPDDVDGIQSLYGTNPYKVPWKPDPRLPPVPDICDPTTVLDAVTTLRGEIVFFKDSYYWHKTSGSATPLQALIKPTWPSGPDSIDAAYENRHSDKIYFSKGMCRKVWTFTAMVPESQFPKPISKYHLPNTVRKVDAALCDDDARKVLLFVGTYLYSFDTVTGHMDQGFPKLVNETFSGLTGKVTAAFQYGGYAYIYTGSEVFEYHMKTRMFFTRLTYNNFLPCIVKTVCLHRY
ncbi:hypothetical protein LDENG_00219990 [Lucifuga dentata]|nr:hypothetical protein LDENG_00219990 [Lucifuga dentata]